jgi:hypothetical protein
VGLGGVNISDRRRVWSLLYHFNFAVKMKLYKPQITELEDLLLEVVQNSYNRFTSKFLSGYGDVPVGFIPPTEEERRRMEIDYANDKTTHGASRGGW